MTNLQIIDLLYAAIDLAGDGGPSSFRPEEYEAMYNFLNKLREQY